jgi:hypothetical protein
MIDFALSYRLWPKILTIGYSTTLKPVNLLSGYLQFLIHIQTKMEHLNRNWANFQELKNKNSYALGRDVKIKIAAVDNLKF